MELSGELLARLERLAAAGIQLIPAPGLESFFVLERDGIYILVENRGGVFGNIGAPGKITGEGFAPLVARGEGRAFVTKGSAVAASAQEVEAARGLLRDVRLALE